MTDTNTNDLIATEPPETELFRPTNATQALAVKLYEWQKGDELDKLAQAAELARTQIQAALELLAQGLATEESEG